MGILADKKILVTGVLTDTSIAFHVARLAQEEGADIVLTSFGRAMSITTRIAGRLPKPAPVIELDVTNDEHLATLADRVKELLSVPVVLEENEWGIDHGAWSILKYLYPNADVPVAQLSLDGSMSAREHYDLAKQLKPLRNENILILSSGNVVHNLRTIHWQDNAQPYPWAKDFNQFFAAQMDAKHHKPLIEWEKYGEAAHLSIPTPEHYWPALYTLALQDEGERASIFVDGIEMSSISMLGFSVQ